MLGGEESGCDDHEDQQESLPGINFYFYMFSNCLIYSHLYKLFKFIRIVVKNSLVNQTNTRSDIILVFIFKVLQAATGGLFIILRT